MIQERLSLYLLHRFFFLWIILGAGLTSAAEQANPRLNVIVLLADDMG